MDHKKFKALQDEVRSSIKSSKNVREVHSAFNGDECVITREIGAGSDNSIEVRCKKRSNERLIRRLIEDSPDPDSLFK